MQRVAIEQKTVPRVTVIVPVKNRRERMLRCLDAVVSLDYPDYDVLVVDNGSTDGTAEACRERGARASVPVEVHVLEGSVGAIRNRAAKLAGGEIVAFTDSDCMPEPSWLASAVRPFEDPAVGVVCGRTLPEKNVDGARWPATIQVDSLSWRFEACNLLFRREQFVATAGFDERVGHFWEDTAAGMAMVRQGWKPAFAPEAIVRHDVTFPGYRWQLERAWKQSHLGPVLREYPEIREHVLWLGVFQRPRSLLFVAFAFGLALGARRPAALVLAVPYLWQRFPRVLSPLAPIWFAELLAFDAVNVAGGFVGGLRSGRLVV